MGKNLDSRALATGHPTKKMTSFQEVDICAPARANGGIRGVRDIVRPRPTSFSEAPNFSEAPWALQDPIRKRAAETGESRQRRGSAKAGFLGTGQLALRYLHYIVDGESAGA